jgi:hypothetical protein
MDGSSKDRRIDLSGQTKARLGEVGKDDLVACLLDLCCDPAGYVTRMTLDCGECDEDDHGCSSGEAVSADLLFACLELERVEFADPVGIEHPPVLALDSGVIGLLPCKFALAYLDEVDDLALFLTFDLELEVIKPGRVGGLGKTRCR